MRMSRQFRFHATAIGAIVVVTVVLYLLIGPKAPPPAQAPQQQSLGDRRVYIVSATWGEECNGYIAAATPTLTKDENGVLVKAERPSRVERDNVLERVKEICGEALSCEFSANSDTLKVEPMATCFKHLKLGYRCFSYDRLWIRDISQGGAVKIDCHEDMQQDANPATNPKP